MPPDSLAKWYKPANKRQVWLHNMFKLGRNLGELAVQACARCHGVHRTLSDLKKVMLD